MQVESLLWLLWYCQLSYSHQLVSYFSAGYAKFRIYVHVMDTPLSLLFCVPPASQ